MDITKIMKKVGYSFFILFALLLLAGCGSMYITSVYVLNSLSKPEIPGQSAEHKKQQALKHDHLNTILMKAEQGDALAQLVVADNIIHYLEKDSLKMALIDTSKMDFNADNMRLFWLNQAMNQNYAPAFCYKAQMSDRYHRPLLPNDEREQLLKKAIELDKFGSTSTLSSVLATFYLSNNRYHEGIQLLINALKEGNEPALITLSNQYYGTQKELDDFLKNSLQSYPDPLKVETMNALPQDVLSAITHIPFSLFKRFYQGEFFYMAQFTHTSVSNHEEALRHELKEQFVILKEQGKLSFNPRYHQCISGYNIPYDYELYPNEYEEKNIFKENNEVKNLSMNSLSQHNDPTKSLQETPYVDKTLFPNNLGKESEVIHQAAINNHRQAQYQLATLYDTGNGIIQNRTLANYWYLRAALQNHTSSQEEIAVRYREGIGMPVNPLRAHVWFSILAKKEVRCPKCIQNNLLALESTMNKKTLNRAKLEYLAIKNRLHHFDD